MNPPPWVLESHKHREFFSAAILVIHSMNGFQMETRWGTRYGSEAFNTSKMLNASDSGFIV